MNSDQSKKPFDPWAEDDDDEEIDDSTITASKVAEATLLGDKFIPQNKAEQQLKDEIAWCEKNGFTIDIPKD